MRGPRTPPTHTHTHPPTLFLDQTKVRRAEKMLFLGRVLFSRVSWVLGEHPPPNHPISSFKIYLCTGKNCNVLSTLGCKNVVLLSLSEPLKICIRSQYLQMHTDHTQRLNRLVPVVVEDGCSLLFLSIK